MSTIKENIINELIRINIELGKNPNRDFFISTNNFNVSKRTITKIFGTYSNALYEAGLKKYIKHGSIIKNCTLCNNVIKVNNSELGTKNFCNKSCSAIYNNKNRIKSLKNKKLIPRTQKNLVIIKPLLSCVNCKNIFIRHDNRYRQNPLCSVICTMEHKMKKTKLCDIINDHHANRFVPIRSNARNYSKYFYPKKCMNCGYDKHFEVCHIKDIAEFNINDYLYTVNKIDNLIHLCRNCHWEFDSGLISTTYIKDILKNWYTL